MERGGELPLSYAQERLWFLSQLEPDSPAYNLPGAVRLRGRLRAGALAGALTEIVRRHESLRSRFVAREGRPVQVIDPAGAVALPWVDLRALPEEAREEEARRLRREEAGRPFDLSRDPMLRARLLRLGEEDWLCLLTQHHIASDGGSIGVLIREISALYGGEALAEPPVQYVDYAVWQRRWLEEGLAGESAWWREHLSGAPLVLELPTDHPRPVAASPAGGRERLAIPAGLRRDLESLGRREGATLFMTLLAAFSALLSRYADQGELLVGSPVAGRSRRELEGLIGLFVNTLALRMSVEGEPSFRDLLGRAREETLSALAHQEMPFERLVEELSPERGLDRSPLVQVLLAVQETPPELRMAELTLRRLEPEGGTAKFDLSLEVAPEGEGLAGGLEFRLDLFEAATIRRMLGHFEVLLAGAAREPGRPVAELPLLSAEERAQVLGPWSGAAVEIGGESCLHELFEACVAREPEALSLVDGERRWTYGDLNRRANRIAHRLRSMGLGPESRVGVLMGRSAETVAALLGTLKAGAAYVFLDPGHPPARLSFLAGDAGLAALLTEEGLAGTLALAGVPEIRVDAEDAGPDPAWDADPEPWAVPDNLAYVIYTSGSTGRPKGVAVAHRGPVGRMLWARETFGPELLAGVLGSTSFGFDVSVFELFAPLSWGGAVILAESVLALPGLAAGGEVRLVSTVPSAMAELALAGLPPGVRAVALAGEALAPPVVARIYACSGVERVDNVYGPTEDSIYSTFRSIGRGAGRVTIGRPLPGTRTYVVDRRGEPVPAGLAGELLLAGVGTARGYLGRPDLTAERFVPDPFHEAGGRLYRTGDLARWLPGGEIEFLGRLDHQVKVRGFRIELGEIEAALLEHPLIHEAVVVVSETAVGGPSLVAYVAPAGPGPATLTAHLAERLPRHMVPSVFLSLEALPRTRSGKLDRRALPAPALEARPASRAARSGLEELLAGIWAEALGLERVGAEEGFFALGGHSLLAMRVVARIEAVLGAGVTVRDLFEAPTVAALAERLGAALRGGEEPAVPGLRRVSRDGDLPLSSAQERLWFLDQLDPGSAAYNVPAAVRLTGPLRPARACRGPRGVWWRGTKLCGPGSNRGAGGPSRCRRRRRLSPSGWPTSQPCRRPPGSARASGSRPEEALRPFDLARGPLLRTVLVREDERRHLALLTMHHVVSDGWSMGVLIRDLGALYRAALAGTPPALPELPFQYADFAVWQREHLAARAERDLAYWRRTLAGISPLDLPTDRPRPREIGARGGGHPFRLPAGLSAALAALARKEGVTPFMILLAGLTAQLSRYTGQDDVAIGSPAAGRSRAETEGLIGFFVNTLVAADELRGRPLAPRAAGPGARGLPGSLRAPGRPVRSRRRGAGAGARSGTHPAVPGRARGPARELADARARRPRVGEPARRGADGEVRPHGGAGGRPRRDDGPLGLQPGSLRGGHGGADGRALRGTALGPSRASRCAALRAAAAPRRKSAHRCSPNGRAGRARTRASGRSASCSRPSRPAVRRRWLSPGTAVR